MNIRLCILFLGLFLCFMAPSYGQQETGSRFQFAIGVSYVSNQIHIPFFPRVNKKRHWGVSIDGQLGKSKNRIFSYTHGFSLGYQHQTGLLDALYLKYKPTLSCSIKDVFKIDVPFGLGYAHSFPKGQNYQLNDDGIYVQGKGNGKSHFIPSLGLGASFHLGKLARLPLSIHCNYEISALAPYAPNAGLDVIPFTSISSGIKYHFQ